MLIILHPLDIQRASSRKLCVPGLSIVVWPKIARIQIRSILHSTAAHGQHSSAQTIPPIVQELDTDAAPPSSPVAPAVARRLNLQQASHDVSVN
jgi:hypothetical protein